MLYLPNPSILGQVVNNLIDSDRFTTIRRTSILKIIFNTQEHISMVRFQFKVFQNIRDSWGKRIKRVTSSYPTNGRPSLWSSAIFSTRIKSLCALTKDF